MKKITMIFVLIFISLAMLSQAAIKPSRLVPGGNANPPAAAPLSIVCNPCATPEGEPYIMDDGEDVTNGGCFMSTTPAFTPITIGQTYCGNINTYLYEGSANTDLDWYSMTLTATTTVYFSVYTDIYTQMWIIGNDCEELPTYQYAYPGTPGVTSISATLPAGTYWFIVGSYYYLGDGMGTNYMATVTTAPVGDPSTWCAAAVPTLTEWGLIIMGLALVGFGTFFLLRKRG
ncbi:MAG TPA: hypothetical protein PLK82_06955 [Bacteroidales bacterium]|nr:hypothetical protein [Bacteroidales bacterium]